MQAALAVALCVQALMHQGHGHGMVVKPKSRNYWAYKLNAVSVNKEYNAVGMNAGGECVERERLTSCLVRCLRKHN
jgi:predicted carbohydrate-binding protein with CBM5 and CBM33 domain